MKAELLSAVERESDEIIAAVKPLLAGRNPLAQGFALAELTAMWMGGHPPGARERLLRLQDAAVRELVPMHDAHQQQRGNTQ